MDNINISISSSEDSDKNNSFEYSSSFDSISLNDSILKTLNSNINNTEKKDENDKLFDEELNQQWKELNENFINEDSNKEYWKNY